MKVTIKAKKPGQKDISFSKGGLHRSLNVPESQPIPASKRQAALAGSYGDKARKQAQFAQNVLVGRKG
jgi:hypothetical protein